VSRFEFFYKLVLSQSFGALTALGIFLLVKSREVEVEAAAALGFFGGALAFAAAVSLMMFKKEEDDIYTQED
jgi:hypothetical protein